MNIYNNTDNHGSREVEAHFLVRANVQLLGEITPLTANFPTPTPILMFCSRLGETIKKDRASFLGDFAYRGGQVAATSLISLLTPREASPIIIGYKKACV